MLLKSIYVNNETQLLYILEHFNKIYSPKLNTNLVRKENFHCVCVGKFPLCVCIYIYIH